MSENAIFVAKIAKQSTETEEQTGIGARINACGGQTAKNALHPKAQ
jgi:hypothetical protein